jgi:hypothetical protein
MEQIHPFVKILSKRVSILRILLSVALKKVRSDQFILIVRLKVFCTNYDEKYNSSRHSFSCDERNSSENSLRPIPTQTTGD